MRASLRSIAFCFLGLSVPLVIAESNGHGNAKGINYVETTILSPSGPIYKKEWFDTKTSQLIRMEYLRVTPGRTIVGRVRILLEPNGCWKVEGSQGDVETLLCLKDSVLRKPVYVTDGNHRWEVKAIRINEVPLEKPGVATESEPSIDLLINRID